MWIYLTEGALSVVEDWDNKSMLYVRSRTESVLRKHFREEIQYTPERDYPFRVHVSRETFAKVMVGCIINLDYHNFKDEVKNRNPQLLPAYFGVYNATIRLEGHDEGIEFVGSGKSKASWPSEPH